MTDPRPTGAPPAPAVDTDDVLAAFGRLPVGAVAAILWAFTAVALVSSFWGSLDERLASPDDAMRLVQVREFLAGASWFDPTQTRIGLGAGYLTHWSRLIDAPIALLMGMFGEKVALTAWPLLLLLTTIMPLAIATERVAGRPAGLMAALFGALCLAGFSQFRPGIIHHHNAQLAASALFVAALAAAPASRMASVAAGFAGALELAFGLESLPVLAVAIAFYVLQFVWKPEAARNLDIFGLSFAGFTTLLYVATIPSARWLVTECDALAFNMLLLVVIGGAGIAVAQWLTHRAAWSVRLIAMLAVGLASVGAFVAADRSCLAGPYGHFDPALWPVWLDYVAEMLSASRLAAVEPVGAALYFAFPLVGLAASGFLLWRSREWPVWMLTINFLVCFLVAILHVRGVLYANFYAVPVTALALAKAFELGTLPTMRSLVIAIALAPDAQANQPPSAKGAACFETRSYAALAALPAGRVLAQLDLAPFVLANTPHSVVMGPYHRLDRDLVFARRLVAGKPEDAATPLRAAGVDYVVDCAGLVDRFADRDEPMSLRTSLLKGKAPAFLTPVDMPNSPLLVWRVAP